MAAADTFQSDGMPAIGVGCTNALVTQDNDIYFRICFIDPEQGTIDANLCKDLGVRNRRSRYFDNLAMSRFDVCQIGG